MWILADPPGKKLPITNIRHITHGQILLSTPELFQRQMSALLKGYKGIVMVMDDIFVFETTRQEHNRHLSAVLRTKGSGMKLNKAK